MTLHFKEGELLLITFKPKSMDTHTHTHIEAKVYRHLIDLPNLFFTDFHDQL